MTSPAEAAASVRRMLVGVRLSQAIAVGASLGVADALASGARGADDLPAELGCAGT